MNTPQLTWPKHIITEIEPGDRPALIGRAAAFIIDGVECMVLARNADDLTLIGTHLSGVSFDPDLIGKAVMIATAGIAVAVSVRPALIDQSLLFKEDKPTSVPPEPGVRAEDGTPLVQYKNQPVTAGADVTSDGIAVATYKQPETPPVEDAGVFVNEEKAEPVARKKPGRKPKVALPPVNVAAAPGAVDDDDEI